MKTEKPESHKKLCHKLGLNEEREIATVTALLNGDEPKQENLQDIIRAYDHTISDQEQKLKDQFGPSFDICFQSQQGIVVPANQTGPDRVLTSQQMARYFYVLSELRKVRTTALQGCLLVFMRAFRTYIQNVQKKKGLNVSQLSMTMAEWQSQVQSKKQINEELSKGNEDISKINKLARKNQQLDERNKILQNNMEKMKERLQSKELFEELQKKLNEKQVQNKQLKNLLKMTEGHYEGKVKQLEQQVLRLKADYNLLEKEKSKTVQQKERLISKNNDNRTIISHLQKRNRFTEVTNDNLRDALKKLEKEKKMFGQEQKQDYLERLQEMLRRYEVSADDLSNKIVQKEQEKQDLKTTHQEKLIELTNEQKRKMEDLEGHLKKQMQSTFKQQLQKYKQAQLEGIILQLESIVRDLQTKQNKIKEMEQQNKKLLQEKKTYETSIAELTKIIGWREKNDQYQKEFKQNIKEINKYLITMSESSQILFESRLKKSTREESSINEERKEKCECCKKYQKEIQQLQDELVEKINFEQMLHISQRIIQEKQGDNMQLERQLKQVKEDSKKKQSQYFSLKQQTLKLEQQLYKRNSTILTVSPILEGQHAKIQLLISFIQSFTKETILKSELKFRYDDLNNNFGFYLTEGKPFVVLFKLKNGRVMGLFSTGITGSSSSQSPQAFIFSLEGKGCMFSKPSLKSFSPATKLQDNMLIFGNNQVVIRNNSKGKQFQLNTSIIGKQYFMITNLLDLTGSYSSGTLEFAEMEVHRICF